MSSVVLIILVKTTTTSAVQMAVDIPVLLVKLLLLFVLPLRDNPAEALVLLFPSVREMGLSRQSSAGALLVIAGV